MSQMALIVCLTAFICILVNLGFLVVINKTVFNSSWKEHKRRNRIHEMLNESINRCEVRYNLNKNLED